MKPIEYEDPSNSFLNLFERIDPNLPIKVRTPVFTDFSVEIEIVNGTIAPGAVNRLRAKFGDLDIRINSIPATSILKIVVPGIKIPGAYSGFDHLKFIENNRSLGIWLGIGAHGPEFLSLSKLVHLGITGSSGSGKSVCLRSILGQIAGFHDSVRLLVLDPKGGSDYQFLETAPNVLSVGKSLHEWQNILSAVVIEIGAREILFSSMASQPPSSLYEYNTQKLSRLTESLPDLKPIVLAVDEAHMLFRQNYGFVTDCLEFIARKGRAFGITLLLSSQRPTDIEAPVRSQINAWVSFFSPDFGTAWGAGIIEELASKQKKAIPGRGSIVDFENYQIREFQSALFHQEEILAMSFRSHGKKSESGILKLKISRELLDDGFLASLILKGHSIASAREFLNSTNPSDRHYRSKFKFTLNNWHDIIETRKIHEDKVAETNYRTPISRETATLSISLPQKLDNTKDYRSLKNLYLAALAQSKDNIDWAKIDLTANIGLREASTLSVQTPNAAALRFEELILPERILKLAKDFSLDAKNAFQSELQPPVLLLFGNSGVGKFTLLRALARELNASLYQDGIESNFGGQKCEYRINVYEGNMNIQDIQSSKGIVTAIVLETDTTTKEFEEFAQTSGLHFYFLHLKDEDFRESRIFESLFRSFLKTYEYDFSHGMPTLTDVLVTQVNPTPARLKSFVERASHKSQLKKIPFNKQIFEGADEKNGTHKFSKAGSPFTIRIPRKSLSDLILSDYSLEQVKLAIAKVSQNSSSRFAFEEQLSKNHGCCFLFSGPPGGGKSLSAEVLAYETKRPLLVCDIGQMQSPWVGGTESILREAFKAASDLQGILLIDECDSFLRSRKGSSSEYTIKVTNQLLTLLDDQFSCVVVLTTNFIENLDEAVARRCLLRVNFELPRTPEMKRILEHLLKPDAPIRPDFDFDSVLNGIALSGGLIKSAVELATMRMHQSGDGQLTWKNLRIALEETQHEYRLISGQADRVIGIGQ